MSIEHDSVLGLECKIFRNTGTYEAPTWVEMTNVKDVTLNMSKGQADVTTRGNAGWRAKRGTLKEAPLEFSMVHSKSDAGFAAIQSAFLNNTAIELAVMTGAMNDPEAEGFRATFEVFSFSSNQSLEEAVMYDVSMEPTYTANAPEWINGEE